MMDETPLKRPRFDEPMYPMAPMMCQPFWPMPQFDGSMLPFNQFPMPQNPEPVSENCDTAEFRTIDGRLGVIGHVHKYTVTIGEVKRRIADPEGFNKSTLGPYLRRGKTAGCGNEIQLLLTRANIEVSSGKKNKYPLTTLSALVEGEAVFLSRHSREVVDIHFPILPIANELVLRFFSMHPNNPMTVGMRIDSLRNITLLFAAFHKMISDVQLPLEDKYPIPVNKAMNEMMAPFVNATHGFGLEEVKTWTATLAKMADKTIQVMSHCNGLPYQQRQPLGSCNFQSPRPMLPPGVSALTPASSCQMTSSPMSSSCSSSSTSFGNSSFSPGNVSMDSGISMCSSPMTNTQMEVNLKNKFTEVPGRLSLKNNAYVVTIGELKRRVNGPEALNTSIIGGLLRQAKTKGNGDGTRQKLADAGIVLPEGRRRGTPITAFTAIVEGEAVQLAKDMRGLMSKYLPSRDVGMAMACAFPAITPDKYLEVIGFISDVRSIISGVDYPIEDHIPVKQPMNEVEKKMIDFSLITHGFGPLEFVNWLESIQLIFQSAMSSSMRQFNK